MSTSHLRLVAAALSLIVAVFTGLVTGWAAGYSSGCVAGEQEGVPVPGDPSPRPTASPSITPSTGGGVIEEDTVGPRPGDSGLPGIGPRSSVGPSAPGGGGGASVETGRCGGYSVPAALVGFGGALLAGLVVSGLVLARPRPAGATGAGPAPGAPRVPPGPTDQSGASGFVTGSHRILGEPLRGAPGSADGEAGRDRGTLVSTCIYVRDRATSPAIADRLARALHEVGVSELRPVGVPFDPARHEAGGAAPTDDPRLDGTIAAVEIAGYADRGAVLRPPVVTVYRTGNR